MLKLIVGRKGSGKTKTLLSMVNEAVEKTDGKTVCIEKGTKLTYDVDHSVRLIDTDQFGISGYDAFYGFVAGIVAGDFDVKEIFIDSTLKIGGSDYAQLENFITKLHKLTESAGIDFVMTVSADAGELPAGVVKYCA